MTMQHLIISIISGGRGYPYPGVVEGEGDDEVASWVGVAGVGYGEGYDVAASGVDFLDV